MPQRYSGIKELRKTQKRHMHNLDIKTDLKRTIKGCLKSVKEQNKEEAANGLKLVFKKLDKAAKRNIIHKNTAARRKSKFTKIVSQIT